MKKSLALIGLLSLLSAPAYADSTQTCHNEQGDLQCVHNEQGSVCTNPTGSTQIFCAHNEQGGLQNCVNGLGQPVSTPVCP